MAFTVRGGAGEFGTFGIMVAEVKDAVEKAHDLMARGVANVRILDRAGAATTVEKLARREFGHSLSSEQLALVAETSDLLQQPDERLSSVFYDRLFEIAPDVRSLFPKDMAPQRRKFVDTLVALLSHASEPGSFKETLAGLAQRHVRYGALPEHYGPVGNALLFALEDRLGDRFTANVKLAWTLLYLDLAAAMSPST